MMIRDALAALTAAVALTGPAVAQQPLDTQLLNDADFDSTLAAWTQTTGSIGLIAYQTPGAPSLLVSDAFGGGVGLARATSDASGVAEMYQDIDVSGNASEILAGSIRLRMTGYFGGVGASNDDVEMRAFFLDPNGVEIALNPEDPFIGDVDEVARNQETTLMVRRGEFTIPPATATIRVRLRFDAFTGATPDCLVDDVRAELVTAGVMPAPVAIGENLLHKSDFEKTPTEPSAFIDPAGEGWTVIDGIFKQTPYGSGNPSAAVSGEIEGDSFLCGAKSNKGGVATARQWVDVRGNATAIDNGDLAVLMEGYFGGLTGSDDAAWLEVRFFTESSDQIPTVATAGNVTQTHRNDETIVMRRCGLITIPKFTRHIAFDVVLDALTGATPVSVCDNLTASLQPSTWTADPLPFNVNLASKGDFESPPPAPSFLIDPTSKSSWQVNDRYFAAGAYGVGNLPSQSYAQGMTPPGGSYLLTASNHVGGFARVEQRYDLRGLATVVQADLVDVELSGHFGGVGASNDVATLSLTFHAGATQLPQSYSIGGVTAADRNYETGLLFRSGSFRVPATAEVMRIELEFNAFTGAVPDCLADNISVALRQVSGPSGFTTLPLSSSDDGHHHMVFGDVASQLAQLNAGPPTFSPTTWSPITWRHQDKVAPFGFQCGDVGVVPKDEAYVSANTYIAGADEVTADNCGSAFYRFTFTLPNEFANPILTGVANADDMAVLYLNGFPVSAPIAANLLGTDAIIGGVPALTWPTQDTFCAADPSWFLPGENELVFAVAGDVSDFEPTGVEFQASVTFDVFGQPNSPVARLEANGLGVGTAPGPFNPAVPAGGSLHLAWGGPAFSPILLLNGSRNPANTFFPGIGTLDIGDPSIGYADLTVLINGLVPPANLFGVLDANGNQSHTLVFPPATPLGPIVNLQGVVVQPDGTLTLTAAHYVDVF